MANMIHGFIHHEDKELVLSHVIAQGSLLHYKELWKSYMPSLFKEKNQIHACNIVFEQMEHKFHY